jgi:hypothetical protein
MFKVKAPFTSEKTLCDYLGRDLGRGHNWLRVKSIKTHKFNEYNFFNYHFIMLYCDVCGAIRIVSNNIDGELKPSKDEWVQIKELHLENRKVCTPKHDTILEVYSGELKVFK